jgi:hypothetical protein
MSSTLQRSPQPRTTTKPKGHSIRVSPILTELAHLEKSEVLARLKTSQDGLAQSEAQERLVEHGPDIVASEKQHGWLWRLFNATRNLLVILLTVLGIISFVTGDFRAGTVMMLIAILGAALRFVQESRADAAAAKLKAMISVTAAVVFLGRPDPSAENRSSVLRVGLAPPCRKDPQNRSHLQDDVLLHLQPVAVLPSSRHSCDWSEQATHRRDSREPDLRCGSCQNSVGRSINGSSVLSPKALS